MYWFDGREELESKENFKQIRNFIFSNATHTVHIIFIAVKWHPANHNPVHRIHINYVISVAAKIIAAVIVVTVAAIIITTEIQSIRGVAIIAGTTSTAQVRLESHPSITVIGETISTRRRTIESIIRIIVTPPAKVFIRLLISEVNTTAMRKQSVAISVASAVIKFAEKSPELIT